MSELSTSDRKEAQAPDAAELDRERYELLQRLRDWLETPMLILAFVWLALLVVDLVWGEGHPFQIIGTIIWAIFVLNFAVELTLAPRRGAYLRRNWLLVISLLIPALRIFRIVRVIRLFRLARVGRGVRLFRVVTSLNRGMRALGASLHRRGFGYVLALTLLVVFAAAAGMYAFESGSPGGLNSYGEALWWTAMIMTTMGSQYWPETFEGRVLCVFLALYAFGVFGYVTATLATYFVGRDAESGEAELAGARELALLREEISSLRDDLRALSRSDRG